MCLWTSIRSYCTVYIFFLIGFAGLLFGNFFNAWNFLYIIVHLSIRNYNILSSHVLFCFLILDTLWYILLIVLHNFQAPLLKKISCKPISRCIFIFVWCCTDGDNSNLYDQWVNRLEFDAVRCSCCHLCCKFLYDELFTADLIITMPNICWFC